MRILMQSFIIRHGQYRQGRTVATGITKTGQRGNPKASVGRRSAKTESKGQDRENNPGARAGIRTQES